MKNSMSDVPKFFQPDHKGKLKIEDTDLRRVKKAIIHLCGVILNNPGQF
jgi:hypothetical protein